jgi:toxin ParE1/3/4
MANVIISIDVHTEIHEIYSHLHIESPSYAEYWLEEFFRKSELLENFPKMGRMVPEVNIENIREYFVGRHRIIYSIIEQEVRILAIRHGRTPLNLS